MYLKQYSFFLGGGMFPVATSKTAMWNTLFSILSIEKPQYTMFDGKIIVFPSSEFNIIYQPG